MSNYVVIARFSQDKTEQIMRLREKLSLNGYGAAISEWPPHITLAAYESIGETELCDWVERYAGLHRPFDIVLPSLAVLPPGGEHAETAVLCFAPASSKSLIDFYFGLHERFDSHCGNLGFSIRPNSDILPFIPPSENSRSQPCSRRLKSFLRKTYSAKRRLRPWKSIRIR